LKTIRNLLQAVFDGDAGHTELQTFELW